MRLLSYLDSDVFGCGESTPAPLSRASLTRSTRDVHVHRGLLARLIFASLPFDSSVRVDLSVRSGWAIGIMIGAGTWTL